MLGARIGWLEGNEVTEVEFNPRGIAFSELLRTANQCEVAFHVYARSDAQRDAAEQALGRDRVTRTDAPIRPEPGQKHFLSPDDALLALPMTEAQATRINSIIALQPGKFTPGELPAKAREQLSPRQLRIYEDLLQLRKTRPNALSALTPDRSPKGLPAYAATVEALLTAQRGK